MSRSAVCRVSVSSPTRNPASTNVRATRSQTSPAASIAIDQQRNHQLTPTRAWNIAPVFRSAACGQRKASTAPTSATHRKLAADRTIFIVSVSIVALSIIVMAGITQHGGAAPSVIAPRIGRTWLPADQHQQCIEQRSKLDHGNIDGLSIDHCDSRTHSAWGR
jgi:hypothetical protein